MRIQNWSVLAIAIMVLGVPQSRAQEIVGTASPTVPTHILPAPGAEPCVVSDGGRPSCCQRLCNWLTYRPLSHPGCCDCCKPCEPCGMPPLYIFFMCDRYGHGGAAAPGPTQAPISWQSQAGGQTQAAGN
jgi:hypothetical protein